MSEIAIRREPVRLNFHDGDVMVTPKDQDIFFISAEKATEACRGVVRIEERVARFKTELLIPLQKWCQENKSRVSACYLVVPESSVLPVYMIGASDIYDFDLTKKLSALAFWFEENGWAVHASQIPRCDEEQLSGFFNLDHALQVFGVDHA